MTRGYHDAHPHEPNRCGALLSQRGLDVVDAVQYGPGETEQHLPIIGQAELARRPMQQTHAEVLLEEGNLPRDGSLADVALAGNS